MNCWDALCMFVVTEAAVVVESSCRQPWIIAIIFIVMFIISVAAMAIIFVYYWRYV